jgi:hypothetical protein
MNTDTPLPPDEATGPNPPDGAIIDYSLQTAASGPVTLEILESHASPSGDASRSGSERLSGERERLVRRYSSADRPQLQDSSTAPVPVYWYRPPQVLSAEAGMHRFMWDLHYQPAPGGGGRGGLPIAAIAHDTAPAINAPWVAPGVYTVKLTVDGESYTQPLTVKMDPRVKTPPLGLAQQFTLSKQMYDGMIEVQRALEDIQLLKRSSAGDGVKNVPDKTAERLDALAQSFTAMSAGLGQLMNILQQADVTPTTQLVTAVRERRAALSRLGAEWNALKRDVTR